MSPHDKVTERMMLDLVHQRYNQTVNGVSPRYVVAEHVQHDPMGGKRCLDAVVADMWRSDGYAFHGIEIKCSRSDLKRELDQPWKAEAFSDHLDYFWVAVSSIAVLKGLTLPRDWGVLYLTNDGRLRSKKKAPRLRPVVHGWAALDPIPRSVQTAMLRATRKTYENRSRIEEAA